jgi:hypothetical protein
MARYILIDRSSGFIFADTADLPGFDPNAGTPIDAAKALDADIKNEPAEWEETGRYESACGDVFDVWRADINGSEAVPVVQNGQDQEMIDAVERDCRYITSLRRIDLDR